jgi:malonyl-CoA O-methyltransferase
MCGTPWKSCIAALTRAYERKARMNEKMVKRVAVREGYDLWADSYDRTPNPVVAMDSRHTLNLLDPKPGQKILDAGCGTGRNLARIRASGAHAYGMDFSLGMLRVASNRGSGVPLVQADLQAQFPFRPRQFHAVLCALIGEHLDKLGFTLHQLHDMLEPGGCMVFSVYHPDLAEAGKEANFAIGHTEYRLGAIRYAAEDYVRMTRDAGFCDIETFEYRADNELIQEIPSAADLLDKPVILALRACAGGSACAI